VLSSYVFFFFSSRRRHTRLQGDWSSDVCSSDLRSQARRNLTQWKLTPSSAAPNSTKKRKKRQKPKKPSSRKFRSSPRKKPRKSKPAAPLAARNLPLTWLKSMPNTPLLTVHTSMANRNMSNTNTSKRSMLKRKCYPRRLTANPLRKPLRSSKKTQLSSLARLGRRELVVPRLLAQIFRVIPPASAATHVHVSSGRSAAADATVVAADARTAVADVPIAADALAGRDSNAAGQVV